MITINTGYHSSWSDLEMASLFTARRKPKRIVRSETDDAPEAAEEGMFVCSQLTFFKSPSDTISSKVHRLIVNNTDNGPVVRRPGVGTAKVKSKLRMSFNPGDTDAGDTGESQPRTSKIGALNIQRRDDLDVSQEAEPRQSETRPSYSKAYLEELRNSTPSTPRDLSIVNTPNEDFEDRRLDIESKFGRSGISSGIIPSAAEIQEKKERRARLAKEQGAEDFIPLEDYDSDGEFKPQRMQVGTYLQRESEKDTRLVRDDEDIAEGFDEFVEDSGRVTLSKKGAREQSRKERAQMRELIEEAEDSSDQDDSDIELHHAYESAQTHHGMDGLGGRESQMRKARRPKQPKETTQIPKLATALARLKEAMQQYEFEKARLEKRRADIQRERADIIANQEHIQKSLEEAGKELEKIQRDTAGVTGANGDRITTERGLESFGNTPDTRTPE